MKRLTKRYPNGNVTLDAAQFEIDQNTLDSEIKNSEPIAAAVKRLAEFEDVFLTPEAAQQALKARTDK